MASPTKVQDRIQLVRGLSNELAAYLHTLPESIWRNADDYPSPCEGWKMADVVTHLIMGANFLSQSIGNALEGVSTAPMGYTPFIGDEALEMLVQTREAFFEDLFYEFNASCLRLNSALVSLEPDSFELAAWHPLFTTTIENLINIRASELAVHGWDVRYPMDRDATLNKNAVPFLKDDFLLRWLHSGFQKSEVLEKPIRFRFRLTDGADEESYDVAVTGDKFRLGPSDDSSANVTFVCDTDTYILLCMGRLSLNRSVRRGRILLEGDADMARQFGEWFKGV